MQQLKKQRHSNVLDRVPRTVRNGDVKHFEEKAKSRFMLPPALLSRRQAGWLLQEAELLPCPSARNAHGGSGQPLRLASPPAGTRAQEMWTLPHLKSASGQLSLENLL